MKRLVPRALLALFVLVFTILSTGCNVYRSHLLTIRANYNVSRGEYQPAIVDYLRARESGQYDYWLAYNLGNVYHYLGESNAALERWDFSRASEARDLRFGASFNRGVYFFEQGRYREARSHFRTALEVNPTSIAAKRNLELTLERLTAETDLTGDIPPGGDAASSAAAAATNGSGGGNRMLDYMRRREEQRWRANQQFRVTPDVEDW